MCLHAKDNFLDYLHPGRKKNPNKFGVIGSYLGNCKNFFEKSFRKKRNLKLACYDCILNIDMNGPKNSL